MDVFPRHLLKISRKKPKHVDTVVNSIQTLTFPITNVISNTHNNQIPQVNCFGSNLSKYSRADQDFVSDEISYTYDRKTSYTTDSVVFLGSKPRIGINFFTDYLKAPSTALNGSSSSIISG